METILGADGRQAIFAIAESSQIAAMRRHATDLAARLGFNDTEAGQLAIAVTEAASNLIKHAGHGEVLLRPLNEGPHVGIEMLALDRGPGIGNLHASMQDGASTTGTYGGGLGAMRRLAQEFDIYTAPGKGTVIGMALWAGGLAPPGASIEYGVVCLPMRGETVSGDSWGLRYDATTATVLMADGLGHGPHAAEASELACSMLASRPDLPPELLLEDIHAALRATRGAAAAIATVDTLQAELRFAGIGNIAAHVYDAGGLTRRQMVSHNGIVGSNMRKVQEFRTPWPAGALAVLHSDGLQSRWDLDDYPGLAHCHARVIAGLLYRDYVRGTDDVSVLVLRDHQRSAP